MKVLALILARGGSKRLPGKNIRPLGEKPLIVWSIEVVLGIPEICDVLVSTDDAAIAEISRAAGALVPWLRPAELATDTASSTDAAIHALDWYEKEKGQIQGLLLLQPTSPFRSRKTVVRGIELFKANQGRPVIGISPAASHPMWCFRLEGNCMQPFVEGGGLHLRSQDLPPAYVVNGVLYLIKPNDLKQNRTFFNDAMIPLVIDHPLESVDIDTEYDWRIAEAILSMLNGVETTGNI